MTLTSTAERLDDAPVSIDSRVLEILASRLCHDLISPVGAVHNGVEFLQEMGLDSGEEAVSLIAHSAGQAAARLQIFRIMYGAGGRDGNIKPAELKKLFGDLVDADGKVKQDWNPQDISATDRPQGFCKMLLGAMMLAMESLPKGGTVRVVNGDHGAVIVTATGADAAPRPQTADALARALPADDLDPRLVHPFVMGILTAQYGYSLRCGPQEKDQTSYILASP